MSSATARTRAYRLREAEGRIVVSVEIGAEEIETLVEARVLGASADFHSREAIAVAIQEFLKISRDA